MSSIKSFLYTSLFAISSILLISCSDNDADVIAWVNQYPISNAEFEHWMLLQRAAVHNYFYTTHNVADSKDFWETETGGESPLEMLKEMALDKAIQCKVQQIMALERGIVDHIDFDQMMLEMQEENLKRQKKIEKGEIVYGAKRYTERTYFAHEFDKMVIQLKSALSKDELKPTEKQIEALLKNENYPVEANRSFYQMQYVEANYAHFIDSLTQVAEIELNHKNWNAVKAFFK